MFILMRKIILILVTFTLSFFNSTFVSANTTSDQDLNFKIIESHVIDSQSANLKIKLYSALPSISNYYDIKVLISKTNSFENSSVFKTGITCPCKGNLQKVYGGELDFKVLMRGIDLFEYKKIKIILNHNGQIYQTPVNNIFDFIFLKTNKIISINKLPFEATESSAPETSYPSTDAPTGSSDSGGSSDSSTTTTSTPGPYESNFETTSVDGQPQTLTCIKGFGDYRDYDPIYCSVKSGSGLPWTWMSENGSKFYFDGSNYVQYDAPNLVPCDPRNLGGVISMCYSKKNDPGYFYTNTPKPKDIFTPIVITTEQYLAGDLPKEISKKKKSKDSKKSDSNLDKEERSNEKEKNQQSITPSSSSSNQNETVNDTKKLDSPKVVQTSIELTENSSQTVNTWIAETIIQPITNTVTQIFEFFKSIFNN